MSIATTANQLNWVHLVAHYWKVLRLAHIIKKVP